MQEIRFLTEKDMEYFYKLEEQGDAVIIRLELEQLLSLDLSELDRRKTDADSEISEEEIRQWLQQHFSELWQRYEENEAVLQENRQLKNAFDINGKSYDSKEDGEGTGLYPVRMGRRSRETLVKLLQQVRLDDEQARIVNNAIHRGIDDEILLVMLRNGLDAEKMQKLCDTLT